MKKTLLALMAFVAIATQVNGQTCTPDPLYMDSTYGAWPDTIVNFAPAQEGVFYNQVLDFKLPADAGDIDPAYSGVPVDSAVLTNVTGLPPGITYACNVSTCTWYGGDQGCASIYGTPTVADTFDIVVELDGWVTVFGFPTSQPVTFTGYKIIVSPAAGISVLNTNEFAVTQNSPNPFSEETTIGFTTGKNGNVSLKVMDLLGNLVHAESVNASPGINSIKFKNDGLSNGVYMYTLFNGERSITKKMIIRR